jgi:hypothetical protein
MTHFLRKEYGTFQLYSGADKQVRARHHQNNILIHRRCAVECRTRRFTICVSHVIPFPGVT